MRREKRLLAALLFSMGGTSSADRQTGRTDEEGAPAAASRSEPSRLIRPETRARNRLAVLEAVPA